jgi:hypothetical protein
VYNLFADKWLKLNAVSDEVYNVQTASIASCESPLPTLSFFCLVCMTDGFVGLAGVQYGVPLTSFDKTISRTGRRVFFSGNRC